MFQPPHEPPHNARHIPLPWTARVINWPALSGSADSRSGALEELRKKFEQFKSSEPKLPRPGTKVPIKFAARERVSRHSELAKDFIKRILEIEWAWISDESSLWDFHGDQTNKALVEKIQRVYGVDVSDLESGNLADIFDRIRDSGGGVVGSSLARQR
jgi:hypothetical protein